MVEHESYPDPYHDSYSKTVFGFWIYILTDFILFGVLLATFAVLRNSTFGGPHPSELFHLPFNLIQTLILLTSSFTIALGGAYAHRKNKPATLITFLITFILGLAFILMEKSEFSRLIATGNSWQRSGYLSAYFTLLGTHALHMLFALLWVIVLMVPVVREGLTPVGIKRITCLRMFWQFLNIVWIFIFTIVYLLGVK